VVVGGGHCITLSASPRINPSPSNTCDPLPPPWIGSWTLFVSTTTLPHHPHRNPHHWLHRHCHFRSRYHSSIALAATTIFLPPMDVHI
jgi:hypothetical protein